jgi:hypothetical protein
VAQATDHLEVELSGANGSAFEQVASGRRIGIIGHLIDYWYGLGNAIGEYEGVATHEDDADLRLEIGRLGRRRR